jgi:hypothetical protein
VAAGRCTLGGGRNESGLKLHLELDELVRFVVYATAS